MPTSSPMYVYDGPIQAPPSRWDRTDSPREFVLEEVHGRRRRLVLRGPGLPRANETKVPLATRLQTRRYGRRGIQRPIGCHAEPVNYTGEWNDNALAQAEVHCEWRDGSVQTLNTAAGLEWAVRELVLGMELLHLTSPHSDEFEGRISRFVPGRGGRGQRSWEIEFEVTDDLTLPPDKARAGSSSRATITAPEGVSRMLDSVGRAFDPLEWFQSILGRGATAVQDILDLVRYGPLAWIRGGSEALHQALSIIENGVVGFARLSGDAYSATEDYKSAWQRMADASWTCQSGGIFLLAALENETPSTVAGSSDPEQQFAAGQELGAALALARNAADESARIHHETHSALGRMADSMAHEIHWAIEGEDLRDVARAHYGDPDEWTTLATENGLSGYNLSAGQRIRVPRRSA